MIEFNKNHYLDLEERRDFYKQKLGDPVNTNIYNYYIDMIGAAIAERVKDADFNHMKFPCSIGIKQEMIKIIMIIQADAKASMTGNDAPLTQSSAAVTPTTKKKISIWKRK